MIRSAKKMRMRRRRRRNTKRKYRIGGVRM